MGWIKGGKAVGEYVLGTETLRALDIFSINKNNKHGKWNKPKR